ncbi:hypothetical protein DFH07DRAFT_220358 [Mycena maculata]|uniref:MYND-type domain-containing protein n=1 Tax=Mycena maculata TaxID=230809 RepID=A0AAD7HUS3_9AGAR|nr:hypothetical protein DFH07DRAFT_220358 [Mycena maculata]
MHPSLRPENVAKLPPSARSVAESALAGSLTAVHQLCALLPLLPTPEVSNTLPCVFANIDTSGIPSASELDAQLATAASMLAVELALSAVTALAFFARASLIPVDACPEIWPRFWKWTYFFHQYWDSLTSVLHTIPQGELSRLHASCIVSLCNHSGTMDQVHSTPGVPRILAMAWKTLVDAPRTQPERLIREVYDITFVFPVEGNNSAHFDEVVDGVGGNLQHLAAAFANHFSLAAASPDSEFTGRYLMSVGIFLGGASDPVPFQAALRAHGILPTLLTTISALHNTPAVQALTFCLTYLCEALGWPPGYTYVTQALDAGLLRVVVRLATSIKMGSRDGSRDATYISVKLLLKEAKGFASASHIDMSAFRTEWNDFVSLTEARLQLLHRWEGSRPYFKACDNLKCGKIGPRRNFQCCGGCRTTNYCSTKCQSADWHNSHREICDTFKQFKIEHPEILTIREKGFLRALLTADYLRLLPGIFIRQVIFMHSWPREPFYTVLTYSDAHEPKIEVCPQRAMNEVNMYTRTVAAHSLRSRKSGARMEVHLVFLYQGAQVRPLVFPMRAATATLHLARFRAVRKVPPGMTVGQVLPEVKAILEAVLPELEREMSLIH